MEKRWDLNKLYTSFDAKELQEDLAHVEQLLSETLAFAKTAFENYEDSTTKLLRYFKGWEELTSLVSMISNYAHLVYAVDTKNATALKLSEKVESYTSQRTQIEVSFRKWVKGLADLDALLSQNKAIEEYGFMIKREQAFSQYLLSDAEELLLAEMKNTGSNAWSKLQNATIASLMVDYKDEKLPITIIRNYAYASDPEKRKLAYESELKAYEKIEKVSAACLNAIKGEVITEAKKRGYESPLQMTLLNSRMDLATLDAMMEAIEAYLPVFRKYLKKKAALLGHPGPLPFYDLFAPVGSVDMVFTYE
ncbi:MAG: oligoendopeptidase F, partial [Vallitaleaceae bacterium]|nr:oligoendopeptidase F [Vallitaleaceae bacterium]